MIPFRNDVILLLVGLGLYGAHLEC